MIIDGHNHLTEDYSLKNADGYFSQLDKAGVERIMICAISHSRWGGNPAVLEFKETFPERIFAFAYINVDGDDPEDIKKYKEHGFVGLKVIQTEKPYDNAGYMKYYQIASETGMPVLFHTGFLGLRPGRYVNCDYYRPITLDTIARQCPDLRMLCAHMGNPWWDEGFLVMWKHKNIYCDMSGLSACHRDLDSWISLFKPNGQLHEAISKLIFGSDQFMFGSGSYSDYYIQYHSRLFDSLDLDVKQRTRIFHDNFHCLIGES